MSKNGQCFRTESFPIDQFLSLSGVLKDYLHKDPKLKPFISTFQDLDELQLNINAKQQSYDNRSLLHSVLTKQLNNLYLTDSQQQHLEDLKKQNTFCITTAHQTNLFGGPLYFIQKAISTIKVCQLAKEKYPQYNFVPMYWLGTEDHDFDELNHTMINNHQIVWKDEQGGAFGRYSTIGLKELIEQLDNILGESNRANQLKEIFKKAYLNQTTIADATMVLLQEVLGKYGLLMIDGDDIDLKKAMIPIFEQELRHNFSKEATQQSIQFLEENYGKSQAHSRVINLFYLTDHSRKRIVKQPYGYSIYGTKLQFTENKLLDELYRHPERFSPNVMLRPVMQEICLPNLMYIGGGGELSYWFELKPIFDSIQLPYPMLGLRDSAIYISQSIDKKIKQIGEPIPYYFHTKDQVIRQLIQKTTKNSLDLSSAKRHIYKAMEEMQQKAREIDFTLSASAKAEEQRMMNALSNLEKKMMRAEKKNHQILLNRIDDIYDEIYPKGSLQERSQNFSQYYLEYGEAWIDWMLANFNLFDQEVKVMIETPCDN